MTMPLFIAILLYPSEILSFLFHKAYIKDLVITRLLAISYLLLSISWMAERILIAKNKKVIRVASNYIFASSFVVLSFIFAYFGYGLLGVASAFLFSSMLDSLVKYILVAKITKVFFIDINHIKILTTSTIAALLSYMIFLKNPLLFMFFFFILYSAILWIAGVFSQRALFDLRKMITKEITIGESND